jgi:predicted permease
VNTFVHELRYAARSLRKSPGFSAAAIGTLALGIAAASVVFSILHAVVLAPLPYREPERLVAVWEVAEDGRLWRPAPATFRAWREHAGAFESLAAFGGATWALAAEDGGAPVLLRGARVTPDYFTVLGVTPLLGRAFRSDDAAAGAAPVIALGHALWVSRFGADPSVLGRPLALGERTYTVVGVMPPAPYPATVLTVGRIDFAPDAPQFFVPAALEGSGAAGGRSYVLGVLGRLRDGISIESARGEMTALARRLHEEDASSRAVDARVSPLAEETAGAARPALWILFAAVIFLLAIGCANVTSLELARAEARARELDVRAALGASRARIASQILLESVLVAAAACALGVLLAFWALPVFVALMPPGIPRLANVRLHGGILAFAAAVSAAAGIAAGVVPALRAARAGASKRLAELGRGATAVPSRRRALRLIVLGETAVAVLLASGAILLTRSFLALVHVDPGFRSLDTTVAHFSLPRSRYGAPADVARFQDALLSRVRALPGVESASLAYNHPLEAHWMGGGRLAGAETRAAGGDPAPAWFRSVSEDYFRSVGVPLVEGRDFAATDDLSHPPVAIVNSAFVRERIPDGRPLGRILESGDPSAWWGDGLPNRFEIVGVSADVRFLGLDQKPAPAYYLSVRQFPLEDMNLLVRGSSPAALAPALRRSLAELDPGIPFQSVSTLSRFRDDALAPARLNMRMMVAFGGVAAGLAMLGVYGLLSYVVALRRKELSIRIALGAGTPRILSAVLGESAVLAAGGALLGVAGALALSPLLSRVLYGVRGADAASLGAAALSLFLVTLLASGLPARRAARIAPTEAMKGE